MPKLQQCWVQHLSEHSLIIQEILKPAWFSKEQMQHSCYLNQIAYLLFLGFCKNTFDLQDFLFPQNYSY